MKIGLIVDDATPRRPPAASAVRLGEPRLHLLGDRDACSVPTASSTMSVTARLAVQERRAAEFLLAVDDLGDVSQADDVAGAVGDGDRR